MSELSSPLGERVSLIHTKVDCRLTRNHGIKNDKLKGE